MKSKLHAMAGALALVCITAFWTATLISEFFLSVASVVLVKNAILSTMWILIPALVVTGASGFALSRSRKGRLVA